MAKIKVILANPMHPYLVSQCGENDCNAHIKKNRDYYEHASLFHFTDEHHL